MHEATISQGRHMLMVFCDENTSPLPHTVVSIIIIMHTMPIIVCNLPPVGEQIEEKKAAKESNVCISMAG